MSRKPRLLAGSATPLPQARRLFGLWWRRQSPARQDRLATLAPLVSVLLFLAAIIAAFWYLRNEESERETESVKRDVEITQQQLGLRLVQNQEQVIRIARELVSGEIDGDAFAAQAIGFARERPEILRVLWLDAGRRVRANYQAWPFQGDAQPAPPGSANDADSEPERAFRAAGESRQPAYTRAYADPVNGSVFQMVVPLVEQGRLTGAVVVEYSVSALLRFYVPNDVAQRHLISVLDPSGVVLASTVTPLPGQARPRTGPIVSDVPLAPAMNGMLLRAEGFRTSIGLIGNTLFWMVAALSALTVWMLFGTWRHVRRRSQMQQALVQETNFRRAMENSMPTAMRALDMEGRVTYVNAAFCQMTGLTEAELIGSTAPFPYWPPDRTEENARLLQQELQGRSPAGGMEVKVMRRDGSLFDARVYVSPLVDSKGHQSGWMASMTNITEAKRIRDQLSASHERFTTVLEGLDASVSVLSVQQGELLFANRSYRLWFGGDARGHALLAGGATSATFVAQLDGEAGLPADPPLGAAEAGTHPREVYVENLQKWFDVRARYLQWTDGRLAQMLIATDITARRRAEEQAAQQAENAQVTSRLVTMGEMASSVAHELNQPLTAIANYCNGMISRVKADAIAKDALVAALEKTAHQAQRAGQVIHRIRSFVRRSEPQRQPADPRQIVDDAVELAGIELRRRNVMIHTYVAQRMPQILCDPILVEQVLLNLLKNAAEAIDAARLPAARRHIELRVAPRRSDEEGEVIDFSITDAGPGLKDEVQERLYEPFFSTKAGGLGIGLSLCRSIVESHRGRMRAQNLYNGSQIVGCRFSFTLPATEPGPSAGASGPETSSQSVVTSR